MKSTLPIKSLKEVDQFKNFYQTSSEVENEDLLNSIANEGQKLPIVITHDYQIIDGYRRVYCLKSLNIESVDVIISDDDASIKNRIIYNKYRKKTTLDEVREIKTIFNSIPKKQGIKNGDEKYSRAEILAKELNHRWKGDKTLKKIEEVIEKDLDGDVLLSGILDSGWSIESCHDYVTNLKEIDFDNNYNYTQRLQKGELTIQEACKFIKEKQFLENEYEDTFKIPEKATSLNIDCIQINQRKDFLNTVDLIFTSIPYYELRYYQNKEEGGQLGHESTPEDFCRNIAKIFKELVVTLKDTSNILINVGETYMDGVGLGIPDLIKESILKETGLIYKDRIVWSKPNPKPQSEHVQRPINNLEYILWFVVDPKKSKYKLLKYTDEAKKISITSGAKDVDKKGKVAKKVKSLTKPYSKIYAHIQAQDVETMIKCATAGNSEVYRTFQDGHPAIMAELLPVVPILMTTDEEDTVYDPFAGSNVVGRMTLLLNRKALSTELSSNYHKMGCKILSNALDDFNQEDLEVIHQEFINEPLRLAA